MNGRLERTSFILVDLILSFSLLCPCLLLLLSVVLTWASLQS